jgi:hypothetical protein
MADYVLGIFDPVSDRKVFDLYNGGKFKVSELPRRATIVFDVKGGQKPDKVLFTLDGKLVTTERTAPYCISGDTKGDLNPFDGLKPGDHTLKVNWADKAAHVQFTVVPSPPPPPPVKPPKPPVTPATAPSSGWTNLPLAAGARQVYVSTSSGNDSNDGLSPSTPVKSVRVAVKALRDGTGDRLMLKAGDVFKEGIPWKYSGQPGGWAGVFAYGDGPRPLVLNLIGFKAFSAFHHVAIVGIEFKPPQKDPSLPDFNKNVGGGVGIDVRGHPCSDLLFEDCKSSFFEDNFAIHGNGLDTAPPDQWLNRVTIRRCVSTNAWSYSIYGGQGIYAANINNLTIEESFFDHNGWNEQIAGTEPTIYRHGMYLAFWNSGVVVRNNIISRNASFGTQSRSGGVMSGNLFYNNGIAALLGWQKGDFLQNVVVSGHAHRKGPIVGTGKGGLSFVASSGTADGNLFLDKAGFNADGVTYAIPAIEVSRRIMWTPDGPQSLKTVNNCVCGWMGPEYPQGKNKKLDAATNPGSSKFVMSYWPANDLFDSAVKQCRTNWDDQLTALSVVKKFRQ